MSKPKCEHQIIRTFDTDPSTGFCGDCGSILSGLTSPADRRALSDFVAEYDALKEENSKLRAQLWVANDSSLRTYDGMADKADRYDKLLEAVNSAISSIRWSRAQADPENRNNCILSAENALTEAITSIVIGEENDRS